MTLNLPCFGIKIELDGAGAGSITSGLHDADEGQYEVEVYAAQIDVLESLILAHACAGVDVTDAAYVAGIQTAVDALVNNS